MLDYFYQQRGITLMELMIVVVIVGILASIAYPSYQHSLMIARRAEGAAALIDLQNRMERHMIDRKSYLGAYIGGTFSARRMLASNLTENNWYEISICTLAATTYKLCATPQSIQSNDSDCGTFELFSDGTKSVTGSSNVRDCW